MKCERSVITMTLLRLGYLVHSLGNRAMTLLTETALRELFLVTVCCLIESKDNDLACC